MFKDGKGGLCGEEESRRRRLGEGSENVCDFTHNRKTFPFTLHEMEAIGNF